MSSGSMSTTMNTSTAGESDDMDKVLTSYFDKTVNSNTIKVSSFYIVVFLQKWIVLTSEIG